MIEVSASSRNARGMNQITLTTMGKQQQIEVASKPDGFGSVINGGEFFLLALATCYSNDLYREAKKMNIKVSRVDVEVWGDAPSEAGDPFTQIQYKAEVAADASETEILELMQHTDAVAEIHNTLRSGLTIGMGEFKAVIS
jgi:uncharacterized OsmC-like protein